MLYIFSPLLLLFMARTVGFDLPHPATHSTLKSHSRARISHTAIRRLFLLTSDRLFFFFARSETSYCCFHVLWSLIPNLVYLFILFHFQLLHSFSAPFATEPFRLSTTFSRCVSFCLLLVVVCRRMRNFDLCSEEMEEIS